jgi:hypothetical protein
MRSKLLDFLTTYVGPGIFGTIAIDGYRRQVFSHEKDIQALEAQKAELKKAAADKITQLQNEITTKERLAEGRYIKLEAQASRLEEAGSNIKTVQENLNIIDSKLELNQYAQGESREALLFMKQRLSQDLLSLNQKQITETNALKEFIREIRKSDALDWL